MCATKPSGWPCKSVTCVQAWTYFLEELCIASTVGPKPAPRAPWHAVGPAALPTFVCAGELAWALCNYPARFPPVNASLNLNAGGVATLG